MGIIRVSAENRELDNIETETTTETGWYQVESLTSMSRLVVQRTFG